MDEDRKRLGIGLLIIALVAFAIVVLPSGGDVINVAAGAIQAAFLAVIAFALVRMYRARGSWLSALPDRDRGVLYGALALGTLVLVARGRFQEVGDGGTMLWLGALAACAAAIYWVWRESRRYII